MGSPWLGYTATRVSHHSAQVNSTFAVNRFWLENTIWFKLSSDDQSSLTGAERRYVEYYERHNQSDG